MECVGCGGVMRGESRQGVEFDRCPACQAIWFDRGELEALLQGAGVLFNERALKEGIALPTRCRWCETEHEGGAARCDRCERPLGASCPRDGRPMLAAGFGDLELDLCPKCGGIWFDGREFGVLLRDVGAGGVGAGEAPEAVEAEADGGRRPADERGPCQICGETKQGGALYREHGFLKCVSCLGPVDEGEGERMALLRARNDRYWRGKLQTERLMRMDTEDLQQSVERPEWLQRLGSWFSGG